MLKNFVRVFALAAFMFVALQSTVSAKHSVTFVNQTRYNINFLEIDDIDSTYNGIRLPHFRSVGGVVISANSSREVTLETTPPRDCVIRFTFEGETQFHRFSIENFTSYYKVIIGEDDEGFYINTV